MLKFQAVAEKTAKNFRGLLFLPHPVYVYYLFYFVVVGVHRCKFNAPYATF